jgi:hypothetical protein
VPFVLVSNSFRAGQGDSAVLLVGISNVRLVEISFESILIFSTRLVGNLDATSALVRILKEIDIRTLVEPVMPGLYMLWTIKVMNVCKT